jgi:hypothetical protein
VPEKLPQGSTMADLQSDELATAGELSAEFISEQYLDLLVGGGEFPKSVSSSSFRPPSSVSTRSSDVNLPSSSSRQPDPDDEDEAITNRYKVGELRMRCQAFIDMSNATVVTNNVSDNGQPYRGQPLALAILARLKTTPYEWCKLVNITPSKTGGYSQVSWAGANKFATVGEVVCWSKGQNKPGLGDPGSTAALEVSHLCHNPRCIVPEHIVIESQLINNARKGCPGWIQCSDVCGRCHGRKVIWVCAHEPPCVMFHQQYTSHEELLKNGICIDRRAETLARTEAKRTAQMAGLSGPASSSKRPPR